MEQTKITKPKPTRRQAVDRLLAQLPTMERKELLKLWRDLFDRVPGPALRRETLIPILAYRIQEKAYGGLKTALSGSGIEVAAGAQAVCDAASRPADRSATQAPSARSRWRA